MSEKNPVLIVIAGPNGSGKTSLTGALSSHRWFSGAKYINADNIAQQEFGDWNSPVAVLKAAQKAQVERELCLDKKQSFAFETVFSSSEKVEFLALAKNQGFFIRLFFVGTDSPAINASRVAQRVMEGGHDVPIPKIIGRYTKSISNCEKAIQFVDRAYVYDNSIDGYAPELMFRSENGLIMKQYQPIHSWADPIFSAIDSCSHRCEAHRGPADK
jgi:predicted ABC-type ATPase